YQPRLLAQEGEAGLGKGMDGHAGKDLVVKVPCGTLVWKLDGPAESNSRPPSEEREARPGLTSVASRRPLFRTSTVGQALESDLEKEERGGRSAPRDRGELVIGLTTHGQQFVLCKGGRGGLGNRNFATAARQAPRFAQPGESGDEGDYLLELRIIAE